MILAAFVLLAVAAVGFLYRLIVGPSLADRIIAVDGALLIVISVLAVESARTGDAVFVDGIVIVGLLGFVGTSVAARFVERRGG
ncbi:monovalent cation/H+ antiporter complex subunit F [Actinospongicola halichondriae]|uniref:monovalent cation/H+ antiporter complex subunit F n=1 Tax=Actinospongicola halichondriae TaxID=3236844 RepID=UPI003D4EB33A